MNVLLLDDEAAMVNILKKAVPWEKLGFREVYTAYNAEQAQELMSDHHVDIAICDIELPGQSGLDFIEWLQKIYPEVICIILTGHPDFNYARSAISLGVYRYLLKPVSFEELEKTLSEAVDKIEDEKTLDIADRKDIEENDKTAVSKVKDYLDTHYNEVVTRERIEKLVHLNRDYINRIFKMSTGYSLMEYIQYDRIIAAKRLLTTTGKTIVEIGMETGFDSQAYFTKVFRKWTGTTPSAYRKEKNSQRLS